MLKIADFVNFGPKYLGLHIFPRNPVCGNKLEIEARFTYIWLILWIFYDTDKWKSKIIFFSWAGSRSVPANFVRPILIARVVMIIELLKYSGLPSHAIQGLRERRINPMQKSAGAPSPSLPVQKRLMYIFQFQKFHIII